uniref:Cyclic nucleotide-binding domain-containing protein n=1 Tax=Arcella intermedia TaxID=1963864 RepID=A0A6B2KXW1_9EUKA
MTKDIIQHYVTYLNDDLLINTQIQKSVKNLANTLQNISSDLAKDITMALNQALKNPRSSLALDLSSSRKIDQVVLVIEPKILAEQLTIVEKRFYHSTETGDFYNRSWSNDGTVSALTKYIAWINKMSGWVMREIIVQHQPAKQAEAIDYFVQVAMILFSLNNFNSTNHIIGGLHSPSVTKLKKAWALISKKTKEDLETVTELLTPKDHYRNYKEHLAKFDPTIHSVIPMLNPPLAELFFNEEVQKTYMDEQCKWINWIKLETLARILWDYKRWKNEYYLEPNESLADFLENSAISWEVNPSYAIAKMKNDSGEDFPPIVPCPFNTGKVNDFYDGNFFTHGEIQLIMLSSESSKIMKPDTVLIARESPVEKIWLIETGEVAIEGLNSANERNQIQKVGKYQLFGHEMLIYSQPKSKLVIGKQNQLPLGQYRSTVWITTIEYVKICDIDPTNLLKLFKTESGLFLKVTKYLLGHLSILSNFKAYCGTTNEEVAQQPDTPETNKKKSKRPPSLLSQKNVSKKNLEDVVKEVPLKEWTCVLSRPTVSLNGTLSVTQNHLCFIQSTNLVKSAKSQKTIVVPMVSIENIRVKANSLTVSREKKGTLEFADFENISEVNEFLGSALSRKLVFKTDQANSGNSSLESSHIRPNISSVDIRQLTEKDWEYINDASSPVAVFKEGGTILSSSDRPNRTIYKVVEGTVTIRDEDAEYTIEKEGFFGIETFVLNCIRNYEVVATATPTKIQLFEGYFLDYLEVYHPVMAARFNLHLAKMIQKKLQTSISKRNNWDPNKT